MPNTPKGWRAWMTWAALAAGGGALSFLGTKAAALVLHWISSL